MVVRIAGQAALAAAAAAGFVPTAERAAVAVAGSNPAGPLPAAEASEEPIAPVAVAGA